MNTRLLTFALAGLLCTAAGCDFLDTGDSSPEVIVDPTYMGFEPKSILIDSQIEPGEYPGDDYRVLGVVGADTLSSPGSDAVKVGPVTSDTLGVFVQFSGGCEAHEFELVSDGSFAESSPAQVGVRLFHESNGDACRQLASPSAAFDLTPLRERYQEAYGEDSGTLLLNFGPEGGEAFQVKYEF